MNQLAQWMVRLPLDSALPSALTPFRWAGILPALLLVIALLALIRGLYEPGTLEVTENRLVSGAGEAANPDVIPAGGNTGSVRVALFSDLHADSLRIKPEELVAVLIKKPVDFLVFLGDLASDDRKAGRAIPFLQVLSREAKARGIPFLAVLGNHDGPRARKILSDLDVEVLENTKRVFKTATGMEVLITGFPDLKSKKPDIGLLNHPDDSSAMRLVLVHNPDTILHLPEDSGDFLLGGHFHGGQIYAPYQLEFRLLRSDKLPRMGIWRGIFRMKGYTGYITRGLGCVWLPLRVFSKPEFTLLELMKKGPASSSRPL